MKMRFLFIKTVVFFALLTSLRANAEDGYELWLRYNPIGDADYKETVSGLFSEVFVAGEGETFDIIKDELSKAGEGMLGLKVLFTGGPANNTSLVIGTENDLSGFLSDEIKLQLKSIGKEGYFIDYATSGRKQIRIIANEPVGALYGTFHLLRLLQSGEDVATKLPIAESPKITHRILNHWDNLDRTVERGYAGFSIWNWHTLPDYIDTRYIDYARANASIGINGTVLTNVNANSLVLSEPYLQKVKALADVFRPYGIRVYLTARFSSPIELGKMETADPLDDNVRKWWKDNVDEIYELIPDFGGFVVKANSEGQPGPQNYNRSHADGANMLAEALDPHHGIVMWRAFVYSHEVPDDRAKQANNEFEPFDGDFLDNVFIQVKNGAIDFQPREPFHPLFGAMPKTKLALELQITMEYLGQATHLVYLAPLFKECLESKTYRPEKTSTVADVIDGSAYNNEESAIAGVSNIGNDRNWTGHLFNQANWYCYGRLAWNHALTSEAIAQEWISLTFGKDPDVKNTILRMMMDSRENTVNYMTPLGLHHIMGRNHHYGPGPWVTGGRPDWTSVYYHKADSAGIGFDRTASGSNALDQYAGEIETEWSDPKTCPEKYLLWLHHLPWSYKMKSGNSLWDELCIKYDSGVEAVADVREQWKALKPSIDPERFEHVSMLLAIQEIEAKWWRNACLLYFQQFSGLPFPDSIEPPEGELEYYQNLRFPYAPGIRPSW
jgi:alpha-glucuronidase